MNVQRSNNTIESSVYVTLTASLLSMMAPGNVLGQEGGNICGNYPSIRKIVLSRDLLSMMALSGVYFSNRRGIITDGIAILLSMMAHGDFGEESSSHFCGNYPTFRKKYII